MWDGKFTLVTGGVRGIGRRIALTLTEEGCSVSICARNSSKPGCKGSIEKSVTASKEKDIPSIGSEPT